MGALSADLLGLVSHELRSPLAVINGYAATLRLHERRLSVAERQQYLRAIEEATLRLDASIGRMLLFAQLEAGTLTIVRSPVDMLQLIREAVSRAPTNLARTSSTLTPHLKVITPPIADGASCGSHACVVVGDARLLRVVLDQLIENALKFTSSGEDIEIAVHPVTQARDSAITSEPMQIEVLIHNTGVPIPPEHLERIFDHFHQADSSPTREVGGLGLGLAICKRIVVLHGGVLVASSDEHGSTFTVRLPATRETN